MFGIGEPLVDDPLGTDAVEDVVEQTIGSQDLPPHDAGDDLGQDVRGEEQCAQHGATAEFVS